MLKKIARSNAIMAAAIGAMTLGLATPGQARDVNDTITVNGVTFERTVKDEITMRECGDCHMVFPPSRLTQGGWKKIMADLGNHFGEDASLEADTVKHIEDYLVANAYDKDPNAFRTKLTLKTWKKKGVVDPIRITEVPGWYRHHNNGRPHYKQMVEKTGYTRGSNCQICHKNAEFGLYEEFGK